MTTPHNGRPRYVVDACATCGRQTYDDGTPCVCGDYTSSMVEVVPPADIVDWLRGRMGAHGGGFTSADDVADAIHREFTAKAAA